MGIVSIDRKRTISYDDDSTTSDVESDNEMIVGIITTVDQLTKIPKKYCSGDERMPLQSEDHLGNVYKYALNPATYSVIFILLIELLERFSFYG
jgi:hypothetical protein